jgi:hypothetical protein
VTYIPMIDTETGEVDSILVAQRAETRACSEWGGPNPPPSYQRQALAWCLERANSERLQWRSDRGLPDDTPMIEMNLPSWGASGDSYGRV